MAKSYDEKIAEAKLKIEQEQNNMKQLIQKQKEQVRKDRTKRLCKRMGLFESMLPDTITLTDEQFQGFLEKTILTDFARRILDEFVAKQSHPIQSESINTVHSSNGEREQNRATAQG